MQYAIFFNELPPYPGAYALLEGDAWEEVIAA